MGGHELDALYPAEYWDYVARQQAAVKQHAEAARPSPVARKKAIHFAEVHSIPDHLLEWTSEVEGMDEHREVVFPEEEGVN